jgi:hypothetical protein
MHPPRHRFPAPLRENILRPALWLLVFLFSAPAVLFLGCAGGSSSLGQFFGSTPAATPAEQASSSETATPSASTTPAASSAQSRGHKKSGKDVHIAAEKASEASESAAEASAKAQQASKEARQAADAASKAETEGGGTSSRSVVSLEASSPVPQSGSTPAAAITMAAVPGTTPAARPTLSLESRATASVGPPDVATAAEPSPTDAAKLIAEVDKIEKRIDRKNLSTDEAQRDILAQRLLQGAKKALAERDNVAALSLASKASTLLAPLPKVPSSANRTMR